MNSARISASFPGSNPGLPTRRKRYAATPGPSQRLWPCLLALLACLCARAEAQTNQWTWMGGQSTIDFNLPRFTLGGYHGAMGVASPANLPGMREGAATWTDRNGNLWMFGGSGYDADNSYGYLNDLWEFNPATNEWAWMGGASTVGDDCAEFQTQYSAGYVCGAPGIYGQMRLAAAGNTPGGRESAISWIDKSGNLWLFGGQGYEPGVGFGYFNDLWRFNPSTVQWTWMGGSPTVPGYGLGPKGVYGTLGAASAANIPGGRSDATGSLDPGGNLWLFGGVGADSTGQVHQLNDLWEYNPSTGNWTWESGSTGFQGMGVYGVGVAAPGNVPGSRQDAALWFDASGRLWLFGGEGYDFRGYFGYLNDFWQFNPSTKFWNWVGGSDQDLQPGVYGAQGQSSTAFIPGARYEIAHWTDAGGHFWVFGGRGVDSAGDWGDMNDLWEFDPAKLEWTWRTGSRINNYRWFGLAGVYGTLDKPAVGNTPGGRDLAATWTDAQGNLWLFAGEGSDSGGVSIGFGPNDLWRYQLSTVVKAPAATPTFSPAAGSYTAAQQVSIADATAHATVYYSTNAAAQGAIWTAYTGPVTVAASQTLSAIAEAPGLSTSAVGAAVYQLPAATPVFDLPAGTYHEVTVKLTCATPGATIYYTTNGKPPTTSSTVYSGQIVVTSSQTIEAMAVAAGSLNSAVATAAYSINAKAAATNEWTWMGGSSVLGQNGGEPGVYGNRGVFAAGNYPGGRYQSVVWTDKNGNHWMFGGQGQDAVGATGILNDLWELNAATNQWAWMGGSSAFAGKSGFGGVYGTQGVFAAANYPGSRAGATGWTDRSGNLWLFGGQGYDASGVNENILNDLWEFNVTTHQWAWFGGANVLTCPVGEGGTCPQKGIYGTLGVAAAGNTPGSRDWALSWTDNAGNLWLFGGQGIDSLGIRADALNDLWEFNTADKQWSWMGGSDTVGAKYGQPGVYGQLGVASAGNIPGSRYGSGVWTDGSGHLWLFGGWGLDSSGMYGELNDVWEFNPPTEEWTWIAGADALGYSPVFSGTYGQVSGVYGTLGVPAAGNAPGGRFFSSTWLDKSGNVWVFGGSGSDSTGYYTRLNDLWEFNPASRLWTWMGGNSQGTLIDTYGDTGSPGAYGLLGVRGAGSSPGGRYEAANWTDAAGNLWLLGGSGSDSTGALGYLNDLWRYQPVAPAPPAAAPVFSLASGAYASAQTVSITDSTPGAKIYYTTNGATPTASSTPYTGAIKIGQTTVIEAIALAPGYSPSAPVEEVYIIAP